MTCRVVVGVASLRRGCVVATQWPHAHAGVTKRSRDARIKSLCGWGCSPAGSQRWRMPWQPRPTHRRRHLNTRAQGSAQQHHNHTRERRPSARDIPLPKHRATHCHRCARHDVPKPTEVAPDVSAPPKPTVVVPLSAEAAAGAPKPIVVVPTSPGLGFALVNSTAACMSRTCSHTAAQPHARQAVSTEVCYPASPPRCVRRPPTFSSSSSTISHSSCTCFSASVLGDGHD